MSSLTNSISVFCVFFVKRLQNCEKKYLANKFYCCSEDPGFEIVIIINTSLCIIVNYIKTKLLVYLGTYIEAEKFQMNRFLEKIT